jgi:hypothetical protein
MSSHYDFFGGEKGQGLMGKRSWSQIPRFRDPRYEELALFRAKLRGITLLTLFAVSRNVAKISVLVFANSNSGSNYIHSIDYRCADGRFTMLPHGVAVSNQNYLSSSETRVDAGIRI